MAYRFSITWHKSSMMHTVGVGGCSHLPYVYHHGALPMQTGL